MNIDIKFHSNYIEKQVLSWSKIPCHCRINQDGFIIDLSCSLRMKTLGKVISWDQKDIDYRIPALGGDNYSHDYPGLIKIEKENNIFSISSLSMFTSGVWFSLIESCELSTI